MEIAAGAIGVIIGIAIIAAFLAGFFILIGAKMAGIENATIGNSILAAIACTMTVWILTAACSVVPVIGTFIGFFIGLLSCVWILMTIFKTTFGKAFLAWILHFVAQVIAIIIGLFTFAGGLASIF